MREPGMIRGTMTVVLEHVRQRVASVEQNKDEDPEAAHGERGQLLADVVYTIGRGDCPFPVTLAKEAVKVLTIKLKWEGR